MLDREWNRYVLFDEFMRKDHKQLRGDQGTGDGESDGLVGVDRRCSTVGQRVDGERVLTQQIENHRQETLLDRSSDPLTFSVIRIIRGFEMKGINNSGDRSRQTSFLHQRQRSIRRFQLSKEGNEQLIVLRPR